VSTLTNFGRSARASQLDDDIAKTDTSGDVTQLLELSPANHSGRVMSEAGKVCEAADTARTPSSDSDKRSGLSGGAGMRTRSPCLGNPPLPAEMSHG